MKIINIENFVGLENEKIIKKNRDGLTKLQKKINSYDAKIECEQRIEELISKYESEILEKRNQDTVFKSNSEDAISALIKKLESEIAKVCFEKDEIIAKELLE